MYLIKSLNNNLLNEISDLNQVHRLLKELRGNGIKCTFEKQRIKKSKQQIIDKELQSKIEIVHLIESRLKGKAI